MIGKRLSLLFVQLCVLCLSSPLANAAAPLEITWEKLIPAQSESLTRNIAQVQAALNKLTKAQKELYYEIDDQESLKQRIDAGFIKKSNLRSDELRILETNYPVSHPDIFSLWQKIDQTNKQYALESKRVDPQLAGKTVRMPGYVLPLETDGTLVREFLLVPFVGACIHVPPPPPNQMVYVQIEQAFESKALYEPVWVEGVLTVDEGSHSLSLVDGQSNVSTGYAMKAVKVTSYKP